MSDNIENYEEEDEEAGGGLLALLGMLETPPSDQATLPTQTIRIQSSAGGVVDVPVEADHVSNGLPGYSLREVLDMANVTVSPSTQYWLGESQINTETVLAPGATVTGIGLMKGG